jgi:hypothetical protein
MVVQRDSASVIHRLQVGLLLGFEGGTLEYSGKF